MLKLSDNAYRITVFILMVLVVNLTMIASTGIMIVIPMIAGEMALSTNLTVWITNGFLIAVASIVPCSIYFAEKFGYKKTFIVGLLIYSICGSMMAFTKTFPFFIFFRVLSGVGVGIIFPVSLSIVSQTFQGTSKSIATAAFTALGFGLGSTMGFLIGGYIGQYHEWIWAFLIDGMIGLPLAIFASLILRGTLPRPVGGFDVLGYILFLCFVTSTIMWLVNAKAAWNTEGWGSPFIIGCIFVSILSLVALIIEESKKENPLFFLELFRYQSFTIGCLLLFFLGGLFFATSSLFPGMLMAQLKYSRIQAAMHMNIYGAAVGLSGAFTGVFIRKLGMKNLIVLGGVLVAFDGFFQHSLSIYSDSFQIQTILIIRGLGIGLTLGSVTAWALEKIPDRLQGNGSIIVTLFRQLGAGMLGSIINLISYDRNIFHYQRFMENFAFSKTRLQIVERYLYYFDKEKFGYPIMEAKEQTKYLLDEILQRQSKLLALNDAFFFMGIVVSFLLFIIVAFFIFDFFKEKYKIVD